MGSEFLNAFFFASFILMHPFTETELEEILSCKQIFQMKSMHTAKDRSTRPFLKPTWLHAWSQELVFFCEDMHSISGSNGKRLNLFTFQVSKMTVYLEKVCQYRDNEDRPFLRPLLKYHWCQMIFIKIAINMTLQKSQIYIPMWLLNNKLLWITKGYFGPLSFSKCNIYLSNLNIFMVWKIGSFTDYKFDN